MRRLRVYIASPYTVGDKAKNVATQMKVGDQLIGLGFAPFIPTITHYQDSFYPRSYEEWMEYLLEWVLTCDVVYRLPGESPGADREVELAKQYGIPVCYSLGWLIALKRDWDEAWGEAPVDCSVEVTGEEIILSRLKEKL